MASSFHAACPQNFKSYHVAFVVHADISLGWVVLVGNVALLYPYSYCVPMFYLVNLVMSQFTTSTAAFTSTTRTIPTASHGGSLRAEGSETSPNILLLLAQVEAGLGELGTTSLQLEASQLESYALGIGTSGD